MWIDSHVFLLVAITTHVIVGYVLGVVVFETPRMGVVGAVGALTADLDFLFPAALGWPFVHRGITHSLLVSAIATIAVGTVTRVVDGSFARFFGNVPAHAIGGAYGIAYLSHLLIDSTTPKGVPLLYPLSEHSFYVALPTTGHSPVPTLLLWTICLGVLYRNGSLEIFGPDDSR